MLPLTIDSLMFLFNSITICSSWSKRANHFPTARNRHASNHLTTASSSISSSSSLLLLLFFAYAFDHSIRLTSLTLLSISFILGCYHSISCVVCCESHTETAVCLSISQHLVSVHPCCENSFTHPDNKFAISPNSFISIHNSVISIVVHIEDHSHSTQPI